MDKKNYSVTVERTGFIQIKFCVEAVNKVMAQKEAERVAMEELGQSPKGWELRSIFGLPVVIHCEAIPQYPVRALPESCW